MTYMCRSRQRKQNIDKSYMSLGKPQKKHSLDGWIFHLVGKVILGTPASLLECLI